MQRRSFLKLAAATAASTSRLSRASEAATTAVLHVGEKVVASMPRDFTGISIESPQLYNPDYFSAANITLVNAFKKLSHNGIFRSGGHLSDVTRWNGPMETSRRSAKAAPWRRARRTGSGS